MTTEIRLTGTLTCAPDEIDLVRAALDEHIRLSRAEPGCLAFDVTQSPDDPCLWLVEETFRDRAAFEAHQVRTRASAWWQATAHMPRAFKLEE